MEYGSRSTMQNEPIRVLHVLQRMEAGGTQALLMNLYRQIDRSKVQFDFLVEYEEHQFYDDEIISLGGKIYRTSVREDKNIFKFISFLNHFFVDHPEYRIVHTHTYSVGYFVLKAAEQSGIPVRIAHSHSNKMSGKGVVIKIVMKKLYSLHANELFACSKEAGRFLYGDKPFRVIRNAIQIDKFEYDPMMRLEMRKKLGYDDSDIVVGSVGRLHEQKNQVFLLEVFREILDRHKNAKLLLVGDGPNRDLIMHKADALGITSSMKLLSNRNDVNEIYQAMDVFVLPSLYEGLGIAAIEAQVSGLPTFCSDGVAAEAKICELFSQMPLSIGPILWADEIDGVWQQPRVGMGKAAKQSGFDISESSTLLQQWYLNHWVNA